MLALLKRWFGLNGRSDYVKNFFFESNMRAVIYMCIIVILLESWMIARLTRIVVISWPRSFGWMVDHYRNYVILLITAVITLIYAVRFLRGKVRNRLPGYFLLYLFSFVCIAFGIQAGVASYTAGEQVLAFLTMAVFVFCILYWTPIQSLLFTSATFLGFYTFINRAVPVSEGTAINLFTMWIATFMIAMSAYHQKVSEAQKAESIEATNRRLIDESNEDELTGIPNMRCFRRLVTAMILGSAIDRSKRTFLYFDVENFKAYNEKYGYKKGDELLKKIAGILRDTFEEEPIARFSDDHFVAYACLDGLEEKITSAWEKVKAVSAVAVGAETYV